MAEACRDGRLSTQAAGLVAGAVAVNPGAEDDLVEVALAGTLRQVKDRCRQARAEATSHEDRAARDRRIHDERHCRTWTDHDGAFRLDARLTPLAGAGLLAALTAQVDRGFAEARTSGHRTSHDALSADALVALVTGLPGDGDQEGTRRRPPPAQVVLRVDLDLLRGTNGTNNDTNNNTNNNDTNTTTATTTGGTCEIPGVGPVPLETARALLGDALCTLVVTNGVDVTTVCTLGRSVPHALRVALMERDRCCVVPGCDATEHLEIDHWRIPFAEGGPASLDNLARLCRHHHRLRTHRGFTLTREGTTWRWAPPTRGTTPNQRTNDTDDPIGDHPEPDRTDPTLFSLDE
jgi:hypothetical protein